MSLASVSQSENRRLLHTYDRHKVLLERGRGCYLYDDRGRKYLDFLSGIGVNALGHGHPAIRKALVRQAESGVLHTSNLFYHEYQAPLAERLCALSGLERAFFTNSGTEAVEGALKLARAYARIPSRNGHCPAWHVLAMTNSFHGRTFAALSATWTKKYREPFGPLVPGVRFVRFNDVPDLARKMDASVCAVLVEPIQGEGGINAVTPEFFTAARRLTRKHGALLIADEIQCGLGRTGQYFAYQHYGITPDIVTIAKPLAAGLPLGAILAREQVAGALHPGMHGTTFGGGPLACAVALAFLQTLERERLLPHVREIGAYFRERLEGLKKKHATVREVRGLGLMLGLELVSAELAKEVAAEMLQRGVIINRTHETALRFLPPFIIGKKHVDHAVATLDSALKKAESKRRKER
ncbi:MAG TPA: aspartate aminotransferase family protein [Terriglobales bacterium]|nr:aspartate aminotransferase family protein [Terriglobales bacterium]